MRTTLSLDDDVASQLDRMRRERKTRMKDLVNEALRVGLAQMQAPRRRAGRYSTQPVDLGRCLVGSLDDVAEVLAVAEGETYR